MGYLNKATVTVDAILTKKGRELLSRGLSSFVIQKFAVADDEVDYGLYDPSHPLGSEYYGDAIEKMPVLEASPDETQNLRYKLVSLGRGANNIPLLDAGTGDIIITYTTTARREFTPTTTGGLNASPFGYTVVLNDKSAGTLTSDGLGSSTATIPTFYGDVYSTTATVVKGLKFTFVPANVSSVTTTKLLIIGNETGASKTISVTVNPAQVTNPA